MTLAIEDSHNASARITTAAYGAGGLAEILLDFQHRQLSGVVRIEVLSDNTICQRLIVLREGAIVYAGYTLPTPYEFALELGRQMHIGVLDTVLEFAAKRSSIQGVMQAIVEIGILQWAEIAAATRKQAIAVLKGLIPVPGRVIVESIPATFDLRCEVAGAGSLVETLQSASELPRTRKEPALPVAESSNRTRPVVLSVDDSLIAQALVKRALGRDHEIVFCSRTFEALSVLRQRSDISLLLLDLMLPGMSGLELCRRLRGMEQYKGLPIVMLTARKGMVDRMRSRVAGVNHYLTKPITPAALAASVAQYVACR